MAQKHLPLFELLIQTTDNQRQAILKTLSATQLRAILEAIYNVLRGTCPIRDSDKKKLNRYSAVIRRLVSRELTSPQQQRILNKYRRLLPLLLKPVVRYVQIKHDDE